MQILESLTSSLLLLSFFLGDVFHCLLMLALVPVKHFKEIVCFNKVVKLFRLHICPISIFVSVPSLFVSHRVHNVAPALVLEQYFYSHPVKNTECEEKKPDRNCFSDYFRPTNTNRNNVYMSYATCMHLFHATC